MAVACGFTVANIYYHQPLLGDFAGSRNVSEAAAVVAVLIVLMATHLVSPKQKGRTVGIVISGLPVGNLSVPPLLRDEPSLPSFTHKTSINLSSPITVFGALRLRVK